MHLHMVQVDRGPGVHPLRERDPSLGMDAGQGGSDPVRADSAVSVFASCAAKVMFHRRRPGFGNDSSWTRVTESLISPSAVAVRVTVKTRLSIPNA